ncbi:MAG: hypothetical protein QM473_03285, partial [Acidobacteriota bacterium]|nr:hypothetical protein [Acidobacteriota bacterium]
DVHKEHVAEALAEGRDVPPEVLADYPDLKRQYEAKTAPKETPRAPQEVAQQAGAGGGRSEGLDQTKSAPAGGGAGTEPTKSIPEPYGSLGYKRLQYFSGGKPAEGYSRFDFGDPVVVRETGAKGTVDGILGMTPGGEPTHFVVQTDLGRVKVSTHAIDPAQENTRAPQAPAGGGAGMEQTKSAPAGYAAEKPTQDQAGSTAAGPGGSRAAPDARQGLEEKRQMVADMIATKKANREAVPDAWVKRMADLSAQLRGETAAEGATYSLEVAGHPMYDGPPVLRNLIPIKVKTAADAQKALDRALDLERKAAAEFYGAQQALKVAKTAAEKKAAQARVTKMNNQGWDADTLKTLRDETIAELSRLADAAPATPKAASKEPAPAPQAPAGGAQPKITHAGMEIEEIPGKGGEPTRWQVTVPETGERVQTPSGLDAAKRMAENERKMIERHGTRPEREKAAEAARAAEEQARADAKKARSAETAGKSLAEIKAMDHMNRTIRADGKDMKAHEFVDARLVAGDVPKVEMVDRVAPMSRRAFNRASSAEQRAHEAKVKAAGKKESYWIGGYNLSKTEYDYAVKKEPAPAPQAPAGGAQPKVAPEPVRPAAAEPAAPKPVGKALAPAEVKAEFQRQIDAVPRFGDGGPETITLKAGGSTAKIQNTARRVAEYMKDLDKVKDKKYVAEKKAKTWGGELSKRAPLKSITDMIDDFDPQAAVDFAAAQGIDLEEVLKGDRKRLDRVRGLKPTP